MADVPQVLDQSWEDAIGAYLSVRVCRCLRELGLSSLREVIAAARGAELLKHRSFGRGSLRDLREVVADWVSKNPQAEPPAPAAPPASSGAQPGVDPLAVPWEEALPDVSVRVAALLERRGVRTVRDALEVSRDQSLLSERNFGRRSLRDLRQSIEEFAGRAGADLSGAAAFVGADASSAIATVDTVSPPNVPDDRPDPPTPALTIREFVEAAIREVPDKHRAAFLARFVEGRTLEDVGRELDLTRERIRQKSMLALNKVRQRIAKRCGVMSDALTLLDERRILHFADLTEVSGGADARTVQLGLLFAGDDTVQVWRQEFLVRLTTSDAERQLQFVRRALRDIGRGTASIDEAREAIRLAVGWHLTDIGLERLLTQALGVEVTAGGLVPIESLMRWPARFVAMIRDAGRPMHISELAAKVLESASTDDIDDELAEDAEEQSAEGEEEEEGDAGDEGAVTSSRERTPELLRLEHRLESALCHQPELYRVGRGTYVHRDASPVRQDLLREVVDWCVRHIRGRHTAFSTANLLAELQKRGGAPAGLNAYLLKSVLARHPEVVSLRKLLVGHAPSFQEHGRSLADRVEDVLQAADRPLTKDEVRATLTSRGTEFADPSIYVTLLDSRFVLNLGDGRFTHVNRMGLAPRERSALVEAALRLLPEDGTPITARAILTSLDECPGFGDLVTPGRADVFLWALLRTDERIECGASGLVALRVEDRPSSLLETVIGAVLRERVVAPPRELRMELARRQHQAADRVVYNALGVGVARGSFRRAFGSLYTLPDIDERTLLDALTARYLDEAERTAWDPAVTSLPSDQLELVARTLYHGERLAAAKRVIQVLVHRDDLAETELRRVRRLWQVVSAREEDAE